MIEIKNINIHYQKQVINDSHITLFDKGITLIIGKSGSGKTSLIRNILYMEQQFDEYLYNGKIIKSRKEISSCFSLMNQNNQFIEDLKISEHIKLLFQLYGNIDIDEYICSLDINRFIDKYPAQLSGGEKNRVSLIFCIIKNTPIIILDEPTAALDSYYTNKVRNIIKKESKNHLFIISTHDHELYEIADTIYEISDKKINCLKETEMPRLENIKVVNKSFNLAKYFLKMKKHNLFSHISIIFLVVVSVSFVSILGGYSFSKDNNHYNELDALISDEIIIYKPIMSEYPYYFSSEGLESVISSYEIEKIKSIEGISEMMPHIELTLSAPYQSFEEIESQSVPISSITVSQNQQETFYNIEELSNSISLVNYVNIDKDNIEYSLNQEGIYISKELAKTLNISNNSPCQVNICLPIPQRNIIGDAEMSYSDETFTYPVNWVQCKYVNIEFDVAGILKGNDLCKWSYYSSHVIFIDHDVFNKYIQEYLPNETEIYYFDTELAKYTTSIIENHEISNVCYGEPWAPNAYKLKIDDSTNYSSVLNQLQELGYSTISAIKIDTIDQIAYRISDFYVIFSIALVSIIVIIYLLIKKINQYKENSFIAFFKEMNYTLKEILFLLMQKYLINFFIVFLSSIMFVYIFQFICVKVGYVFAPITTITFYMIGLVSFVIEFIFPIILGGSYRDRVK